MWRYDGEDGGPRQYFQEPADDIRRSSPVLIQIVCESPIALKLSMARIRQEGYDVTLVIRVQEACVRRDLVAPDLVVLDARQDLINSAQLCNQLSRRASADAAEVLVILNPEQKDYRSRFISLGAADCVACGDDADEIGLRIQIILNRSARADRTSGQPDEERSPLVDAICEYLTRHLSRPVAMEDLEQRFGRSRKSLNQEFERQLGSTVFAWYRQHKMAYACELLARSALGVEEIAQILGYASVCNFSTAFRLCHEISPRAYRQTRRSSPPALSAARAPASGPHAIAFPAQAPGA